MKTYLKAFLIAGVVIPIVLHLVGRGLMPWWPDTVSTGIGFGVFAIVMVAKARRDRDMNRRFRHALRALARHWFELISRDTHRRRPSDLS